MDGLAIPNYHVAACSCRDPSGRTGGEVSILARHSLDAEPHTSHGGVSNAAEICPVKIYPTTSSDTALLVTGMHIPPESSNALDTGRLAESRREPIAEQTQYYLSRLLTGGLNVTTWLETSINLEWGVREICSALRNL